MVKYLYLLVSFCFILCNAAFIVAAPPQDWDMVEKKIRDESISKKEAMAIFKSLKPKLKKYFLDQGGKESTLPVFFPVDGCDYRFTSKYDFLWSKKFDFFDKNSHSGHPAYDIFIKDKNSDGKDDNLLDFVKILSMTSGVVVSTFKDWQPDSKYRGGNCIWIYDPAREGLFYYAHLRDVPINVGDIVSAGQKIGTLGRTGRKAYLISSPTHLHLMFVNYSDTGNLIPQPIYKLLRNAKTKAAGTDREISPYLTNNNDKR
ncbi:MAG: M23 family metallopeptidase [Elusimicrobiota bacterium]